jgi:tetratricopeptide (TPR) repeat protein
MAFPKFLVATICFALAAPAAAGVTVIGASAARLCYEAAEFGTGNDAGLDLCNRALTEETLIRSEHVATLVNRGILKLRMGRVEASLADFDAAIELDASEPEAYVNKGMALLRLDRRSDEAIALFDAAIERKTRRPALAYYGRAIAHEAAGRARDAYRDFRQASLIEPQWADPKTELGRFTVRRR